MKYSEAHGHIALGKETIEEKISALKKAGVTYFRDGGDKDGIGARAREAFRQAGIEFVTPVYAIYKEGRYGRFLGQPYESIEDYKLLVQIAKAAGADFIKLMLSGIASFEEPGKLSCPGLEYEEIAELVEIAHKQKLSVMAHCNGADTIKAAAKARVTSIEHGIFMDEEAMDYMAMQGIIWVPTITAISCEPLQEQHRRAVQKAAEKGVIIACGSDSGCSGTAHGEATRLEYQALLECGLTDAKLARAAQLVKVEFWRKAIR